MPSALNASSLAEGLRRRRLAVADVVRMVELGLIRDEERFEILDGHVLEMSPKSFPHEHLKGAINRLWGRHCPDAYDFLLGTGLYLSDWTYLEPDFIVFPAAVSLRDLKGPDVLLAIEVADSSLDYDLTRKPGIYASFGVQELWVIDVANRLTYVHREPAEPGYSSIERVPGSVRLEPLHAPAALGFALDDLERR